MRTQVPSEGRVRNFAVLHPDRIRANPLAGDAAPRIKSREIGATMYVWQRGSFVNNPTRRREPRGGERGSLSCRETGRKRHVATPHTAYLCSRASRRELAYSARAEPQCGKSGGWKSESFVNSLYGQPQVLPGVTLRHHTQLHVALQTSAKREVSAIWVLSLSLCLSRLPLHYHRVFNGCFRTPAGCIFRWHWYPRSRRNSSFTAKFWSTMILRCAPLYVSHTKPPKVLLSGNETSGNDSWIRLFAFECKRERERKSTTRVNY